MRHGLNRFGSPAMVGSIATGVMGQIVLVASGVVVARALGPENRGVLGLVLVLSALATQVGSLGVPLSITYWIATENANPRSLLRGLRRFRNLQLVFVLGVQAALILVVLAPRSPSGFLWVGFLSLAVTASGLSQMYGLAVLQGLERFRAFNSLRIMNGALYVAGVVGLWAFEQANLTSITLAYIGASLIAAGVIWLVVVRGASRPTEPNKVGTGRIVSFGLRSFVGSSPPLETLRLDQLLVGLVLPPVALGYYIVAFAFTNLTRFIGQSIGMITYPKVAAAYDRNAQLRTIRHDVALGAAVCGGLTLVLIAGVPILLPFFFGRDFKPAIDTAQILLVATLFAAMRRILVDGTRGSGWPLWGASAEAVTLLAIPVVVVTTRFTDSLATIAVAIAGANLLSLLAIVPALFGMGYRRPSLSESGKHDARTRRVPVRRILRKSPAPLRRRRPCVHLPILTNLTLLVLAGCVSIATGAAIASAPSSLLFPRVFALIVCVVVVCALIRFGRRAVASLSLYACALALALQGVRFTEWMTVSDLFLLIGGALLVPEIPKFRLQTSVQRGFGTAVTLILIGGLLGTMVAQETGLSLVNLTRLVVAAGATLGVFTLWAPSPAELRRFLALVVMSGAITGTWALTHAEANFGRPSGFSGHPNHLALLCLVGIGPAIAFWLLRGSRRTFRFAAGTAALILVGAIIVSGSRSGLVGLGAALVLTALLVRTSALRAQLATGVAITVGVALVGFSALTTENAIGRTFNTQAMSVIQSDKGRRVELSELTNEIRRTPITGGGFSDPLGGHDAYLQLWAAGGVFALAGAIFVIGSGASAAARLRQLALPRSIHDPSWPLLASTISLSGLLVALAFQNALWNRYIWITVALVAVSSVVAKSNQRDDAQ